MKIVKFMRVAWLDFFARKELTVNRKYAHAKDKHEKILAKCFWFTFHLLLSLKEQKIALEAWDHRLCCKASTSSITKDDHFSVWSWNCTSNRTRVVFSRTIFSLFSSFSTMMLLLNRHLTRYKWYFCVILHTWRYVICLR